MRASLALLCLPALAQGVFTASVPPAAADNLAGPCRYELTLPSPTTAARAVLVVFDRGPEAVAFYNDPELYRFAERERLALLLARHCRAKDSGDIDTDPGRGLGRALLTALDQLAQASRHGELQSAKVIAFGFAAAGVLAARMPAFAPERMFAAISYAPDSARIEMTPAAATIPQLVIANSGDTEGGVRAARDHFRSWFDRGAPWMFAIQNGAPRRGALANTKPLLFAWLESMLAPTPQSAVVSLLSSSQRGGWWLYLRESDLAAGPRVSKSGSKVPRGHYPAGWAATKRLADQWLAFEKTPKHPVNPKFQ